MESIGLGKGVIDSDAYLIMVRAIGVLAFATVVLLFWRLIAGGDVTI